MQNINGQMVDVDAIERLHNYYDSELDCEEWVGMDGDADDNINLTMEIRKAQYDYMVDSIYTLKQRYVYAERYADSLVKENEELKEQIQTIYQSIIESNYQKNWFYSLEKSNRLGNYENGEALGYFELPFYSDDVDKMIEIGISKAQLEDFAHKKYEEWKNERVQLESGTETE